MLQENQGLDFQAFFDLLQRLAEERGLMDPEVRWHYGCSRSSLCLPPAAGTSVLLAE